MNKRPRNSKLPDSSESYSLESDSSESDLSDRKESTPAEKRHKMSLNPNVSKLQKKIYIKALQSKTISVLVGPSKKIFTLPESILSRFSPAFEKMLAPSFVESVESTVKLPEENGFVFEEFLVWAYPLFPSVASDLGIDSLVGLFMFADRYLIYMLKNQISDVVRTALIMNRWEVSPEVIRFVYTATPAGSVLRQLFSIAFTMSIEKPEILVNLANRHKRSIWNNVFTEFGDFGTDYFESTMELRNISRHKRHYMDPEDNAPLKAGGACRFHDHSGIPGCEKIEVSECPYPQGVSA